MLKYSNPVSFATSKFVGQLTHNPKLGDYAGYLVSPTPIPSGGANSPQVVVAKAIADQSRTYIQAGIKAGPTALLNLPNPWFFQTVMTIRTLRANGFLKSDEACRDLASQISNGVAAGTGALGNAELAPALSWGTNEFLSAACDTAYQRAGSYVPADIARKISDGLKVSQGLLDTVDLSKYAPIDPSELPKVPLSEIEEADHIKDLVEALPILGVKAPAGVCYSMIGEGLVLLDDLELGRPLGDAKVEVLAKFELDPTNTFLAVGMSEAQIGYKVAITKDGLILRFDPAAKSASATLMAACSMLPH
jgi:hypothetical protein